MCRLLFLKAVLRVHSLLAVSVARPLVDRVRLAACARIGALADGKSAGAERSSCGHNSEGAVMIVTSGVNRRTFFAHVAAGVAAFAGLYLTGFVTTSAEAASNPPGHGSPPPPAATP